MASEATAKRMGDKDRSEKNAKPADAPAAGSDAPLFNPLGDLSRRQLILFGVFILLANLPLIHYFFKHVLGDMPVTASVPFVDDFNRADLGTNYWNTGGHWRIDGNELHSPAVRNNALWLQAALPDNVAIEFDARSVTQEGDIRFELFGDGFNHDSGYTFLFGAYGNQVSAIARMNERGPGFNTEGVGLGGAEPEAQALAGRSLVELQNNGTLGPSADWRMERRDLHVAPGHMYHMRIEAKDETLRWYIDNQLVFQLNDKYRLKGKHHDRFAVSSWDNDIFYDNLSIQPL
jgi:hypothetical protein